jgi:hypothetical protein
MKKIPRLRSGFRLRADARKAAQLNKTFCFFFTQKGCLFEMIIPPITHNRCQPGNGTYEQLRAEAVPDLGDLPSTIKILLNPQ